MTIWHSLNWIRVTQLRAWVKGFPGVRADFNCRISSDMLMRVIHDEKFASRRSSFVKGVIRILYRIGILQLVAKMPVALQPAIDCVIWREK